MHCPLRDAPRRADLAWLTLTRSLGSIFTALVKSFVGDILMPPLSIIFPLGKNIEQKFAVLKKGPQYNATSGYNTLNQAQEDGAVVLAYG